MSPISAQALASVRPVLDVAARLRLRKVACAAAPGPRLGTRDGDTLSGRSQMDAGSNSFGVGLFQTPRQELVREAG